jgi:CBS domain-containing protein
MLMDCCESLSPNPIEGESAMSTTVGDLLQIKGTKVETIAPTATILEAVKRMAERHIGCLAVTTQAGKLSGILSERDCLWKVIAPGRSTRTARVKDAMTPLKQMKTVTPAVSVDECMGLMTDRRHRHLPVVVDGKLAGLISIGDVVKDEIDAKEATIQSLEKYITGTF